MSTILCCIKDLMFGSKVDGVLSQLGCEVIKIRTSSELEGATAGRNISAAVLNLSIPGDDIFILAEKLVARSIPVFGYYPHVDTAARDRAAACGVTEIHPRGAILSILEQKLGGLS